MKRCELGRISDRFGSALLQIAVGASDELHPDEQRESEGLAADESKLPDNLQVTYDALIATGQSEFAAIMLAGQGLTPAIGNTYQYIPCRFDSPFEQAFYKLVMGLDLVDDLGLEVYYNGDNAIADFRIE